MRKHHDAGSEGMEQDKGLIILKYAAGILKAEYKKEITTIFNRNTTRGFSDWRQCGNLCMDTCAFLEDAADALSKEERYADLFEITNRCYMKWSSTDKDDSSGETQDFCACVQENWSAVYEKGQGDISHSVMLKWFIEQLEGHTVIDYMEDCLYDFLLKHFKSEDELIVKKAMIERVLQSTNTSKYSIPVLQVNYVKVLADLETPIEEIRSFVKKTEGYGIWDTLASIEQEYGNYDAAIALHEKRIAERPDPYWSNEHRRALMDIYKKTGDKEKEFEQLQKLLWANVGDKDIFLEYKKHFTENEWTAEWNRILEELKNHPGGTQWYAIEGRFDIIMDMVEEPPVSDGLLDVYKELEKLYPERCFKVRVESVRADAARASKRSDYRWVARKLKKLSKYDGGTSTARKLASEFVTMYPRRSAMIDELCPFL